jgi:predicted DNA-binding WGR domain protein
MRRFEQKTPVHRFWEIEQVGAALTFRTGKVGSRAFPDEKEESYRNAVEAKREAERLVKSRLENDWVEIVETPAVVDFEAALVAGDQAQWAVFADRLLAEGDPRGELITLQHALGKKREAKKRTQAFIAAHEGAFLGALGDHGSQLDLEWRNGYLHAAGLFCDPRSEASWAPEEDDEQQPVEDLLPVLLSLESARFLRVLAVGWPEPGRDCTYEPIIELLQRQPWPKYLEGLVLGDFSDSTALSSVARWDDEAWLDERTERDLWPDLRSLTPLLEKLRTLRSLSVRANLRRLGVPGLEKLESLELHVQHVEQGLVGELLAAKLPSLTSLVVDFPHSPSITPADFAQVLHGQTFPKLTRLGLCGLGPRALDAMSLAPLLPKLTVVDLSNNGLGDDEVTGLIAQRAAFAHLDKLLLRRNVLSKEASRELKLALPNVDLAHQRTRRQQEQFEDRYDEVME